MPSLLRNVERERERERERETERERERAGSPAYLVPLDMLFRRGNRKFGL